MVPLFDQADISIGIILQDTDYASIAIACLWVYDFALTLDKDEFYSLDFPLSSIQKSQSCTALFAFNSYVGGIILFCAESLFMRRVWAVMGRGLLTMCCNLVLFLVPVMVTLTLSNSSSTIMQSPIPKVTSCYSSKQGRIVILAYILLVIGEMEILGLMLYHSWKLYSRQHGNNVPLVRVLVRHNIFYFACGLVFSTTVVVVVVTLPFTVRDARNTSDTHAPRTVQYS
ncbi:hypothetical protein F4604DRAFT_1675350 [Suillus subluteus]|nr:hypothetical protein F4604DRAFT_1675350 [Suillus subluteus]